MMQGLETCLLGAMSDSDDDHNGITGGWCSSDQDGGEPCSDELDSSEDELDELNRKMHEEVHWCLTDFRITGVCTGIQKGGKGRSRSRARAPSACVRERAHWCPRLDPAVRRRGGGTLLPQHCHGDCP